MPILRNANASIESLAGRVREVFHPLQTAADLDQSLIFDPSDRSDILHVRRGHRAIGVMNPPEAKRHRNDVPTALPRRYDAFCFLDETGALLPIPVPAHREEAATYPAGV